MTRSLRKELLAGGNYGRQVASVLAKVAKYLKMIRPELLEDASSPSNLQPVRPLVLVPVSADAGLSSRLRQKWQPGIQAGEFLFHGLLLGLHAIALP